MKKSLTFILCLSFILILLISIISAFSFSEFWNKITGKVVETCTDSDGGKDYYVYGEAESSDGTNTAYDNDGCGGVLGNVLKEVYCDNGRILAETHECENGCSQGICLTKIPTCYDSDPSDNYFEKGYVTIDEGITKVYDVCAIEQGCVSSSCINSISEVYCDNNKNIKVKFYDCPKGCKDGACITECIDSDKDGYSICSGDCNDNNPSVHPDALEICDNIYDDNCDGKMNENCENKICTDSDNGKNYYIKGTVWGYDNSLNYNSYQDICGTGKWAGYILESYCLADGKVSTDFFKCPNGCKDGVCLGCISDCTGEECGLDNCGRSCGSCIENKICINGKCVLTDCISESSAETCGTSVCGTKVNNCGAEVNCGNCNVDEVCEGGTCNQQYTIEFSGLQFHLWDSTITIDISCKKENGISSYCDDQRFFNSEISNAYAYITDSNGIRVQKSELIKTEGTFFQFKGTFDPDSLTDEMYNLGIYAEDINGVIKNVSNYIIFSGQGWNMCFSDSDCSTYHSCVDNKCILNNINYKLGLVYVYNDESTYNPDWKSEFELIDTKVINSIKDATNNKVNPSLQILGNVQLNSFCWNPAEVGLKCYNGDSFLYLRPPGSMFGNTDFDADCEKIETINCPKCKIENITKPTIGEGNLVCSFGDSVTLPGECNSNFKPFLCDGSTGNLILDCTLCGCNEGQFCNEMSGRCVSNPLVNNYKISIDCGSSLFPGTSPTIVDEISDKLSINFDDYDSIFIIFGKFGQVLPSESDINLIYRCGRLEGVIGGYSSLIMSENSIKKGGLIPCDTIGYVPFYDRMGWHTMTHEILHQFGAVDIYDTGTTFGYDPSFNRKRARLIDSKADESIMGNEDRECIDEGGYEKDGNICTDEELERVYVDEYNKQKIGIGEESKGNLFGSIINWFKKLFGGE